MAENAKKMFDYVGGDNKLFANQKNEQMERLRKSNIYLGNEKNGQMKTI